MSTIDTNIGWSSWGCLTIPTWPHPPHSLLRPYHPNERDPNVLIIKTFSSLSKKTPLLLQKDPVILIKKTPSSSLQRFNHLHKKIIKKKSERPHQPHHKTPPALSPHQPQHENLIILIQKTSHPHHKDIISSSSKRHSPHHHKDPKDLIILIVKTLSSSS